MSEVVRKRKYTVESINVFDAPYELRLVANPTSDLNTAVGSERIRAAILRHCKRSHDQLEACGVSYR